MAHAPDIREHRDRPVLVTGATGYIGGRLVPRLLEAGRRVRCLTRDAGKLRGRPWADHRHVEIVEGDLADTGTLSDLMRGCGAAFYLVHSMITAGSAYAETDRTLALGFAGAANQAQLDRIIYLGGLGETGEGLSKHLASRREVEHALASGDTPVTVLRAAMIIGSGSASFEILRYLVERLPVMVTPRWVSTECQPIAVRNVLHYLVSVLDTPGTAGRTLDIGGPEVMTYRQIMQTMAAALGLRRRFIIPVPVLTPRLSSLWIHLVTPLSHRIARPLAEGLRNRVVCRNDDAARLMPQKLLTIREQIDAALGNLAAGEVETAWSDAGVIPGDPDWAGGTVFTDHRSRDIKAEPGAIYRAVCRVGGGHGYYAADSLWRLRGAMDRLAGGPGLRRGRRDPENVVYGDALDFWRVTAVEPDRRLELRAEMKLPGEALLTFEIEPDRGDENSCRLHQTAHFKPRGLWGLLYWYLVLPLHGVVFEGMLTGIQRAAERPAEKLPTTTSADNGTSRTAQKASI
ncbi:MAG: SDR family oxidoreductase [Planctomycetota bacterium]|nr:SDR family oxidoreductase [Planctomycetota bacterium]